MPVSHLLPGSDVCQKLGGDPRRHWARLRSAIVASWLLDGVLLLLFAWAGAVPVWVAPAYAVSGLLITAAFAVAIASGATARCEDPVLVLPHLAAAALLQLTFIVLAPPVAMYFVGVLFLVFGFASLRMALREAVVAWIGVSVTVSLAIALLPGALDLPKGGPAQRLLVGVSILLVLGRAMLVGVFGSRMRERIGRRCVELLASSASHAQRDAAVAQTLHEDLGQELAGVALALAAHETQLRRAGVAGAADVAAAVGQLRSAVEKTRRLAQSLDGVPPPRRMLETPVGAPLH